MWCSRPWESSQLLSQLITGRVAGLWGPLLGYTTTIITCLKGLKGKKCMQDRTKCHIWILETAICATSKWFFSDGSQINTLWPASMAHVLHALDRICLKCTRSFADNELNTVGVIYKQKTWWIFVPHSFLLQPWLNHYHNVNGRITIYWAAEQKETHVRRRKKKKAAAGERKWQEKKYKSTCSWKKLSPAEKGTRRDDCLPPPTHTP